MTNEPICKQKLPFPYNRDLSPVLRHLNRRTPNGRDRLANDPVTAAYLAAAIRLIECHLGPAAEGTTVDPDDDNRVERPLLKFLSLRALASAVAGNPDPFPRQGSVSTIRDRWGSHSDFIADLLRFGLWARHYPAAHHDDVPRTTEELLQGPDFAAAVHSLCYWDLRCLIRMPMFRLELIAAASAAGDDTIQSAISDLYRETTELWKQLYTKFLQAHGLRLRPGSAWTSMPTSSPRPPKASRYAPSLTPTHRS